MVGRDLKVNSIECFSIRTIITYDCILLYVIFIYIEEIKRESYVAFELKSEYFSSVIILLNNDMGFIDFYLSLLLIYTFNIL